MNWITLELPAPLVVFGGIALASILISLLPISRYTGKPAPLQLIQDKMGLGGLNGGLFFLILLFWAALFLLLFGGLLGTVHALLDAPIPEAGQTDAIWSWRFSVLKLASLTAVLAAVVALPFTLIRLSLSRQQVDTALEALTNDKMNTAVDDLHAQHQITKWKNKIASNGWEDDITRRNGAIDRFLGLVQENNTLRPRVDRMLTVYLRELTREYPTKEVPTDATPEQIKEWADGLTRVRSDMENAVQVLSRLPRPVWQEGIERLPDLQKINMQAFDLSSLSLQEANLSGAELQGANLSGAKLQGANLSGALLQRADLSGAELQGADLSGAELQGANLSEAKLQGVQLLGAKLQEAQLRGAKSPGANLSGAQLVGANLIRADLQEADLSYANMQGAKLNSVRLQGADLHVARLQGAELNRTQLQGANLGGAQLQGAQLREAQLQGANLGGADLQGANLSYARLQGAQLRGARFYDADLRGALLQGANLGGADLQGADLSGAMPNWAALREVDLTHVPQITEHLQVMFGDRSVILPAGTEYPGHWPERIVVDWGDFETQWRAWQRKGGFDPDNPT